MRWVWSVQGESLRDHFQLPLKRETGVASFDYTITADSNFMSITPMDHRIDLGIQCYSYRKLYHGETTKLRKQGRRSTHWETMEHGSTSLVLHLSDSYTKISSIHENYGLILTVAFAELLLLDHPDSSSVLHLLVVYIVESRMLEEGMKKPPWRPLHLVGVSTCLIGSHMFTHFPYNLQKYSGK